MNRAQKKKQLTGTDRHIADAKVLIARQRKVLERTLAMGYPSELAESTLDALEGSLRMLEQHRERRLADAIHEYTP
jgi:hypothetical protein